MSCVLGVDFDNTLANYNDVLYSAAVQLELIGSDTPRNKRVIRDQIRVLPDGDLKWQELQAFVYGKGMKDSNIFDGVEQFFKVCQDQDIAVSIISHKTEYSPNFDDGTNLRQAAKNWMEQKRFFEQDGLGLTPDHVYFESTRREKIERIKRLGCTHFIDDLEETFLESSFPENVKKILYSNERSQLNDVTTCSTWKEIYDYFFTKE